MPSSNAERGRLQCLIRTQVLTLLVALGQFYLVCQSGRQPPMADNDLKEKSGSERSEPSEGYRTSAHSPADKHAAGGGDHRGRYPSQCLTKTPHGVNRVRDIVLLPIAPQTQKLRGEGSIRGRYPSQCLTDATYRQPSPTQDGIHDEKASSLDTSDSQSIGLDNADQHHHLHPHYFARSWTKPHICGCLLLSEIR